MLIKMEIQAERAIEKQTERKGLRERRFVPKRVTESVCERERGAGDRQAEREWGTERGTEREGVGDTERERENLKTVISSIICKYKIAIS